MSGLYRSIPIEDEKTPVVGVVYHPIAEKKLLRGEDASPLFLLARYEYDSPLQEVCDALGWQGGTLKQAVEEIKRLKAPIVQDTREDQSDMTTIGIGNIDYPIHKEARALVDSQTRSIFVLRENLKKREAPAIDGLRDAQKGAKELIA